MVVCLFVRLFLGLSDLRSFALLSFALCCYTVFGVLWFGLCGVVSCCADVFYRVWFCLSDCFGVLWCDVVVVILFVVFGWAFLFCWFVWFVCVVVYVWLVCVVVVVLLYLLCVLCLSCLSCLVCVSCLFCLFCLGLVAYLRACVFVVWCYQWRVVWHWSSCVLGCSFGCVCRLFVCLRGCVRACLFGCVALSCVGVY